MRGRRSRGTETAAAPSQPTTGVAKTSGSAPTHGDISTGRKQRSDGGGGDIFRGKHGRKIESAHGIILKRVMILAVDCIRKDRRGSRLMRKPVGFTPPPTSRG
ncbi:hypothetical protein L798_01261 [Zootermopsis nevadensis]|uniref:Uncharacterized protein n=1 Tax=Zootermopsis nevadensis TaxID=136037 RepID=A0A067QWV5_ZOONE|nr:hypothetical protein L798_01261 [Zootermopsis nevadensis]